MTATLQVQSQRARLTLDEFRRIYAEAPTWFQNALDLALITGQRRSDLVAMRFDAEDEKTTEGYLSDHHQQERWHITPPATNHLKRR